MTMGDDDFVAYFSKISDGSRSESDSDDDDGAVANNEDKLAKIEEIVI
jgi:hypothetical protein